MSKMLNCIKSFFSKFKEEDASGDSSYTIWSIIFLSALVGAVAGLGAVLLVSMLEFTQWLFMGKCVGYFPSGAANEPVMFEVLHTAAARGTGELRRWLIPILPALGGLITSFLVLKFAPEAEGHGTDSAIEAYHFRGGKVRPIVPPIKAIATSILIGTGGSAGCEGPITQIGSGFGSTLATLLKLPVAQRRMLMAAGMAAGVGALFHAPMAGALFAAEVLYRDLDIEYEVLVPSIVASVTGYAVFSTIFGFHPLFATPDVTFNQPRMIFLYIVLALVISLGARFYTWFFYVIHELFLKLKVPHVIKPAIGGLLTGIIGYFFLPALCSGYGTIQDALRFDSIGAGEKITLLALLGVFLFKTLTTAFSVGSGGAGGIFGPAIVVGGALGGSVGIVLHAWLPDWNVPVGAFTLVGMVAFFGCAAKTPISTVLMVSEMTGNYKLLVPSMWVCIIAYVLSRKVSLYRSQLPNRFEAPVHRGSMISGVIRNLKVADILQAHRKSPITIKYDTRLDEVISILASGAQTVFPVVNSENYLSGVLTKKDLSTLLDTDPVFRSMLMVSDISLRKHTLALPSDTLAIALKSMDDDDAEELVVVSNINEPHKFIGIISHNDIAESYQREIQESR
jgi:CIC family chloride channel protein